MKTTAGLVGILLLAACGGSEPMNICDEAGQHVAACLGQPGPTSGAVCEGTHVDLASELLALDCKGLRALLANTGSLGKADGTGCLAPWDCPELFEPTGESCGLTDLAYCESQCESMGLRMTECELLEQGVAHCQCKNTLAGLWDWLTGNVDEDPPPPEEDPEEQPPYWE